jgi:hypothetical protein
MTQETESKATQGPCSVGCTLAHEHVTVGDYLIRRKAQRVAPRWAMVTHPEEGTVYCLCCGGVTDPEDYFDGQQVHESDCAAAATVQALEYVAAVARSEYGLRARVYNDNEPLQAALKGIFTAAEGVQVAS